MTKAAHAPLFGPDGVRGEVNNGVLNPLVAMKIGMAAGIVFRTDDPHNRNRVLIGKDPRLSGYEIESALTAGFTSVGMDVNPTGPIPTSAVSMLTRSMRADLGVMISAGHATYEQNGIVLFGPDGHRLSAKKEKEIEKLFSEDMSVSLAKSADLGRAMRIDGVQDRYIELAKEALPEEIRLDGLRVVIDCANGASYKVAPSVLHELGAEAVSIGVEPNGFNINNGFGISHKEIAMRKVYETRADMGIILDGSGEEVLVVGEDACILDHTEVLTRYAEKLQKTPANGHVKDGLMKALQVLGLSVMLGKKVSNLLLS